MLERVQRADIHEDAVYQERKAEKDSAADGRKFAQQRQRE